MVKLLAILLIGVRSAIGQTATVFINDSNGNQTTGTINGGNVFFHDNQGNIAFGTIRDGNVFLNTNKGEITFGTIKNGNVFLTDQKGNTTGTIQNGNIFLLNSDGSITTGNYDSSGYRTTTTGGTTTSTGTVQPSQEDVRAQQAATYQSSFAVGQQIGNAIAVGIQNHRMRSFCKKQGDAAYLTFQDGSIITCVSVNAGNPVREWPAQTRRSNSNLDSKLQEDGPKAHDLMESLRHGLDDITKYPDSPDVRKCIEESKSSWLDMRKMFCEANPGSVYTDLQGLERTCP